MIPLVHAILDTSVLVAGLRSNQVASFQILRAIRHGEIRIALSVALVLEYEAVTLRPGLVPAFQAEEIRTIIDGLCQYQRPMRKTHLYFHLRTTLEGGITSILVLFRVKTGEAVAGCLLGKSMGWVLSPFRCDGAAEPEGGGIVF